MGGFEGHFPVLHSGKLFLIKYVKLITCCIVKCMQKMCAVYIRAMVAIIKLNYVEILSLF